MTPSQAIKAVLGKAQNWVGYEFRPGISGMCAAFVRDVFKSARVEIGVAQRPDDWEWTKHLPQGPDLANSFAGDEVGRRIDPEQMNPGDILLFQDTYGQFPRGTITHVGIYVGSGMMIDRGTAGGPVARRPVTTFVLHSVRRPKAFDIPAPQSVAEMAGKQKLKIFVNDGRCSAALNNPTGANFDVDRCFIEVNKRSGQLHFFVFGREVPLEHLTIIAVPKKPTYLATDFSHGGELRAYND